MSTMPTNQCHGTAISTGVRCRITWDLDANHLCKYHKYQRPEPVRHRPSPWTRWMSSSLNSGEWSDPAPAAVEPEQPKAPRYRVQLSTNRVPSPGARAPAIPSSTTSVVEDPKPAPVSNPTTETVSITTPKPENTESSTSSSLSALSPHSQLAAQNPSDSESPPLWTARYIESTSTIVVRVYSEWSWQCHHDPIVLKMPWWSKMDSNAALFVGEICKLIPYLRGVVDAAGPAIYTQAAATEYLEGLLEKMGIFDGGLYTSDGIDMEAPSYLKNLWRLQRSVFNRDTGFCATYLSPYKRENAAPIWVSKDEALANGIYSMERQPRPAPVAVLLFARVKGQLRTYCNGVTIRWELTNKTSNKLIEKGVACVGEPVPVMHVTRDELATYELTIEVKKKRKTIGRGSTDVTEALFSALEGSNRSDNAPEMKPELINLDNGRFVHFRILDQKGDK